MLYYGYPSKANEKQCTTSANGESWDYNAERDADYSDERHLNRTDEDHYGLYLTTGDMSIRNGTAVSAPPNDHCTPTSRNPPLSTLSLLFSVPTEL
ncbi:hypothetical protein BGX23_010917 [Mortierella sp. AD031]|nr:hypothetical protein BGX23_010917 [Mortierella sp. AD031]